MTRRKDFEFFFWLNGHMDDVKTEFYRIKQAGSGILEHKLFDIKNIISRDIKRIKAISDAPSLDEIRKKYEQLKTVETYIQQIPKLSEAEILKKYKELPAKLDYPNWTRTNLQSEFITKFTETIITDLPNNDDKTIHTNVIKQVDMYTRLMMFKVVFEKGVDINKLLKMRNHFIVASWIREKESRTGNLDGYVDTLYFKYKFGKCSSDKSCIDKSVYDNNIHKYVPTGIKHNETFYKIRLREQPSLNDFLEKSIAFKRLENILNLINNHPIGLSKIPNSMKIYMQYYRYITDSWIRIDSDTIHDYEPLTENTIKQIVAELQIELDVFSKTKSKNIGDTNNIESSTNIPLFFTNIQHLINTFEIQNNTPNYNANTRKKIIDSIINLKGIVVKSNIPLKRIQNTMETYFHIQKSTDKMQITWEMFCKQMFYKEIPLPLALRNELRHLTINIDENMWKTFIV